MTREQFAEMFWAHFPPEVRALRPMIEEASHDAAKEPAVKSAAVDLALKGYTIDPRIMTGQNVDPYTTIALRMADGYTWYPALMEDRNFDLVPGSPGGLGANGVLARPYDPNNPTKRFIPASLSEKDWPPFEPPKPPEVLPTVPAEPEWAANWGPGRYGCRAGDRSPAGTMYSETAGSRWVKVAVQYGPFTSVYWEVQK